MCRLRPVLAAGVVAAALLGVTGPATAAGEADPTNATNGIGSTGYRDRNVWAGYREAPMEVVTPATGQARSPSRFCVRLPLPNQEAPPTGHGPYTAAETRDLARRTVLDRSPGAWHTLLCFVAGEDLPYLVTFAAWNPADPTAGNVTTIEAVEEFARELVVGPAPVVATSPPAERQITGFETWFGAAAAPPGVRSAQAGPLWATAEAVPTRLEIDPGDGTAPIVCPLDGPSSTAVVPTGRPPCARHTYTRVDPRTGVAAVTVRARVVYDVYLTSSDNPTRRLVDTLASAATVLAITVREMQTVLR